MKTFLFSGIVHPVKEKLTLEEFKQVIGSIDSEELVAEMAIKVTNSVLKARVLYYDEVDNLGTFAFSFESMFQTYINVESYVSGKEYNLELIEIKDCDTNKITNFKHPATILEESRSERPFSTKKVLEILHKTKHAHRMLSSLNAAIGNPRETAFYCYIALESIRQHFLLGSDEDNKKLSWIRMREALIIDEHYLDKIKKFAEYIRHGDVKSYKPADRNEFLQKTWAIVDRFLILLDANIKKLDEKKYKQLRS